MVYWRLIHCILMRSCLHWPVDLLEFSSNKHLCVCHHWKIILLCQLWKHCNLDMYCDLNTFTHKCLLEENSRRSTGQCRHDLIKIQWINRQYTISYLSTVKMCTNDKGWRMVFNCKRSISKFFPLHDLNIKVLFYYTIMWK
jgi:hypothetical protein